MQVYRSAVPMEREKMGGAEGENNEKKGREREI